MPATAHAVLPPDLDDAARRSALCTSKDAAGVGLSGSYFAEHGCRGTPLLVRIDSVVDFDAGLDWPAERAARRPQSVSWRGWVRAPLDGRYRFHLDVVGATVHVARQDLLVAGASIDLRAGRYYPIEATIPSIPDATARIRLEWTAPHGARYVVPRALLQLPSGETRVT
jgi:hypothetical protein